MTYHAELGPRRRPWLIATPLILVVALAAVWSGVWYYAARAAEARINDWQAQQAKAGRVFSCGTQTVGGFPFRIEVRCADAAAELKDAQPPVALKLQEILLVAQVWDPKLLIAEFTGPLMASDPGQPPQVTATWTLAQASMRGAPTAPERISIAADDLKLTDAAPGNPPLFDSKHAEFHARVQFGSWPHNPAVDLAMKLNAATAPALGPYTRDPLDADVLAVLHGVKDFTPKPLSVRLREWQAAGGKLEIQNARVAQGETLANATGTLGLSQRGRLDGALQVATTGIERFMPSIGGEGRGAPLSLDRAGPALNAIDRAVPGLLARVAPQAQTLQTGLLGLLGKPVEIEGRRGVSIPVRFTDGAASLGPIPLGQIPPAF